MEKKIILSGMRPTGHVHLGNYHGVIKNWINLQHENKCFFFIADIHSMTTHSEKFNYIKIITENIILEWLALGVDPNKSIIFIQSQIPETFELHAILSMITPVSWLNRVPSYKSETNVNLQNYGFLGYPVLQSSDILIFDADLVPIGYDQIPHLELTRNIVKRFNKIFKKKILKEPEAIIYKDSKILGFDGNKMSKSKNNTIFISDIDKVLQDKIKKFMTDPKRIYRYQSGDPNKCNVWSLHILYDNNKNNLENIYNDCKTAKIGCVECKDILFKNINNINLVNFEKINLYKKEKNYVLDILTDGMKKAKIIAQERLDKIKCDIKLS
jgi:tryptophanyl-tRNA synthetase